MLRQHVTQMRGQVDALNELHGEETVGVADDQLEQLDQIRVGDVRQGAEFLLEAVQLVGAGHFEGLQCHVGRELLVVHPVDDPRATASQNCDRTKALRAGERPMGAADWGRGSLARAPSGLP